MKLVKQRVIPATLAGLNRSLSAMQIQAGKFFGNISRLSTTKLRTGKYTGSNSQGKPVRVRVERPHSDTSVEAHLKNQNHKVPHIHVEYKKNINTGKWGKGLDNNHTLPQSKLKK